MTDPNVEHDGEIEVYEPSPADERRERVFTMRLAGASIAQIAKKEGVSKAFISRLLDTVLKEPTPSIAEMRNLENARLDLVQMKLMKAVNEGDLKATQLYLRVSERRARLNGLDAPHQIMVSANVRVEMERQLAELEAAIELIPEAAQPAIENIVLAEVLGEERDDRDDFDE